MMFHGGYFVLKITKKIKFIIVFALLLAGIAAVLVSFNRPKRYAVFAGYNADGTLHPYVIRYLKALNEVTDGVVYIADSNLDIKEEEKLKSLTIHYENKRHEEYDFGSYKRGFNWLNNNGYLKNADELILANDSTYLLTGLKPMFHKMAKRKDLDFWGVTQNHRFSRHIQTYFIVFRKRVLQSKTFARFINSITHQEYVPQYIVNYEIKLTPMLENLGYHWGTYIPYEDFKSFELPDNNSYPLTLISKYHFPFLKRRTFTTNLDVRENKTELLRYIKKHYPESYAEIKTEIAPVFLPKD